jgi:histidine triad (HIT) family protein
MDTCIFCKIVKEEIPSYKVYEDDNFIGFLDVFPRTKGHTLVIPKNHYRWVYDVPNFEEYWAAVLKVTKAMQRALKPEFVTYATHGLDVPHAHIHIMPRSNHEHDLMPETKKLPQETLAEVSAAISKSFK